MFLVALIYELLVYNNFSLEHCT